MSLEIKEIGKWCTVDNSLFEIMSSSLCKRIAVLLEWNHQWKYNLFFLLCILEALENKQVYFINAIKRSTYLSEIVRHLTEQWITIFIWKYNNYSW